MPIKETKNIWKLMEIIQFVDQEIRLNKLSSLFKIVLNFKN